MSYDQQDVVGNGYERNTSPAVLSRRCAVIPSGTQRGQTQYGKRRTRNAYWLGLISNTLVRFRSSSPANWISRRRLRLTSLSATSLLLFSGSSSQFATFEEDWLCRLHKVSFLALSHHIEVGEMKNKLWNRFGQVNGYLGLSRNDKCLGSTVLEFDHLESMQRLLFFGIRR